MTSRRSRRGRLSGSEDKQDLLGPEHSSVRDTLRLLSHFTYPLSSRIPSCACIGTSNRKPASTAAFLVPTPVFATPGASIRHLCRYGFAFVVIPRCVRFTLFCVSRENTVLSGKLAHGAGRGFNHAKVSRRQSCLKPHSLKFVPVTKCGKQNVGFWVELLLEPGRPPRVQGREPDSERNDGSALP